MYKKGGRWQRGDARWPLPAPTPPYYKAGISHATTAHSLGQLPTMTDQRNEAVKVGARHAGSPAIFTCSRLTLPFACPLRRRCLCAAGPSATRSGGTAGSTRWWWMGEMGRSR